MTTRGVARLGACRSAACRFVQIIAVLGAAAAAITGTASARVPRDPCGSEQTAHVELRLHCGRVFEIPGHQTWQLPSGDKAESCDDHTEEMVGVNNWSGLHGADWDYWTQNGEWVLWDGRGTFLVGKHDQPINVRPFFHNWGGSPWKVRVFFRCTKRY